MCTSRLLWVLYSLLLLNAAFAKHGKDGDGDDDDTTENDAAVQSGTGGDAVQSATTTPPGSMTSPAIPSGTTTASTALHFLQPTNATTCQSLTFRWDTTSLSTPLTFIVTNDRAVVNNTQSGAAGSNDATLVSRTLSTDIPASASSYVWSPVDIPQGLYVVVAFDTSRTLGILAQSPPFSVLPSKNTTCLASSSAGNATVTASVDRSPVSSSLSSAPTSSAGDDDVPKRLSPAALGGTVAGVTVAIVLLVLAFTFPHFWRRSPTTRRPRGSRPGGPYYLF
ncbi:hypothetical protein GY45DRAFT_831915 [Cubamyces sp. BRFM 1775]|nr:hypothetical protein GY45DRAFT_831915 [Cubamyces sp. BRFM 1775]